MKTSYLLGKVVLSDSYFVKEDIEIEFPLKNNSIYDLTVPALKHIKDFITSHYRCAADFGPVNENEHFDDLTHQVDVEINLPFKKLFVAYMINVLCKFDENNVLIDVDLSRYEDGIYSFYIR